MTAMLIAAMLSGPPIGYVDRAPYVGVVKVDRRVKVIAPYRARLLRMAGCESGRRWHVSTGNGFYGGLQFTLTSWTAVGGSGFPHWHGAREQMFRAVKLMRLQGWGAWPVCQYA